MISLKEFGASQDFAAYDATNNVTPVKKEIFDAHVAGASKIVVVDISRGFQSHSTIYFKDNVCLGWDCLQ